jgi:hypothetical protein
MNLKELKSMIKEELESYMHEDDDMNVDVDAGMDDVAVDGGEMDMEAGGGAEDTLKAIYDQLASYFEGGEVEDEMDELPGEEGGEEDMDMGDEESMEEAHKKDDMDEAKKGKDDKDKAKKKKGDDEEKALKERFQKLANIIKG